MVFQKGFIPWNKGTKGIMKAWNKTDSNYKCLVCGKERHIPPSRSKRGRGRFCSKECQWKSQEFREKVRTSLKRLWQNKEWKEKQKRKLVEAKKGKTYVAWNKGKKRWWNSPTEFKRGDNCKEKNKNWKGGITPENKKLRTSSEYKIWREVVFKRDDWTCQKCHIRGECLHADHILPWAIFFENEICRGEWKNFMYRLSSSYNYKK